MVAERVLFCQAQQQEALYALLATDAAVLFCHRVFTRSIVLLLSQTRLSLHLLLVSAPSPPVAVQRLHTPTRCVYYVLLWQRPASLSFQFLAPDGHAGLRLTLSADHYW
ncbi:hypothetical protein E2P81_ATG09073 [Venturia nashicola]|uniref:Uncharacterized protein n=1 Tax=Venturia nashicola TaxID=86259 RepID=A0A4Z1NZE4_9PEZI|nr:hypothetical protein E6O75_ATG09273 [Venturia nashicola]TLD20003.1 hypothetical protein E2P81_ATG09073 [Venturia nashicola]